MSGRRHRRAKTSQAPPPRAVERSLAASPGPSTPPEFVEEGAATTAALQLPPPPLVARLTQDAIPPTVRGPSPSASMVARAQLYSLPPPGSVAPPAPVSSPLSRRGELGVAGRLGASVLAWVAQARELTGTLTSALGAVWAPGKSAQAEVRRILITQVFFTGVQALRLVSIIGGLFGATILLQMQLLAPGAPGDLVGKVLVAVIVRELAPLGTAIVVCSRSATAIATELGNMKVNAEILALASLGVDPQRFIVVPRVGGTIVSVLALMVYFAVVALFGGYLACFFLHGPSFEVLQAGFMEAVGFADIVLYLVKGAGLGTIVGWFACHFGLQVNTSPTEVPQKASQAVVYSLLGCVAFNTAVTALFYAIVGSPLR